MNRDDVVARIRTAIGEPTDLTTEMNRWVDDAITEIHSESRWPWDMDSTSIFADLVLTAVTANWTIGTSSLTGLLNQPAVAAAARYVGGLIELAGGSVYEITAWDVGAATMSVSSNIVEATAVAGATQISNHDVIALPANVSSVLDIIDRQQPFSLSKRKAPWNRFFPNPFDSVTVNPYAWATNGVDSSGNIRLALFPPPDANRTYTLVYHRGATLPTDGTTDLQAVTGIPLEFHKNTIVARAIYEAKKIEYERPDQLMEIVEYRDGIRKMKAYGKSDAGLYYIMQSQQNRHRSAFNRAKNRLPWDYTITT